MWASPAEPVAFGEDLVVEVLHHLTLVLQFLKLVERNLEQNEPLIKPWLCNHKSELLTSDKQGDHAVSLNGINARVTMRSWSAIIIIASKKILQENIMVKGFSVQS